jgi:hypothetical protein
MPPPDIVEKRDSAQREVEKVLCSGPVMLSVPSRGISYVVEACIVLQVRCHLLLGAMES